MTLPFCSNRRTILTLAFTLITGLAFSSLAVSAAGIGGEKSPESRLVLEPLFPQPGAAVAVVYHPSNDFGDESVLHLRARLRTTQDEAYNWNAGSRLLAVLDRRPDGTYAGSFVLPEGAVYAALAVENVDATMVDSRAGAFWEILLSESDGRPSSQALDQRFNDHMGRDMRTVYETAVQRAELYPHMPDSWTNLSAAERWHLGEAESNRLSDSHVERAKALHERFATETELAADVVGSMFWYGLIIRDETIREYWRGRLLDEHPGHYFAIQDRFGEAYREHQGDAQTFLSILDDLWADADDERGHSRLARPGFNAALESDDVDAIRRWADRYEASDMNAAHLVARTLAQRDATADIGMTRLADLATVIEAAEDDARPLGMTAEAHRGASTQRAAAIRTDLARILHDAGRHAEAVAELHAVTNIGWNTARFQLMADALLATGDRESAGKHLAFVAVDPVTDDATVDSLRALSGLDEARWAELTRDARYEMHRRTLDEAVSRDIGALPLRTADGAVVEPSQVLAETATVVVSWSRYCGPSMHAMPNVSRFAEALEADVRVIAITNEDPTESEEHVAEQGWDLPRFYDEGGMAKRALNSWGTPQFFVLDGEGRLRYSVTGLSALPRQIAALRAEREGEGR